MNKGMYKSTPSVKTGVPSNKKTTTELTIGGQTFKVQSEKDAIEINRILKAHKDAIDALRSEIQTLKRDNRTLMNNFNNLKTEIQKQNSRDKSDDFNL